MINKIYRIYDINFFINLLIIFTTSSVFLFFHNSLAFSEAPKNYLKGKFYESVENNFLIATEKMPDQRFKKTVIVILSNNQNGAWGLTINKPIGFVPLKKLIGIPEDVKKEKQKLFEASIPIYWGGPVDERSIFILHTQDYTSKTTENYNGISVTRDHQILFDIVEKRGPKKSLVILGYSGWGDGQLEGEMETDHWILSEINFDIIFEEDSTIIWSEAFQNSFIRL